eukprot:scaffold345995_cov26-Prasinocladus_malaysianus.AAC.1
MALRRAAVRQIIPNIDLIDVLPRQGTGLMWVPKQHHGSVIPAIVSHGCGNGFTSDFIWDGTTTHINLSALIWKFWNAQEEYPAAKCGDCD